MNEQQTKLIKSALWYARHGWYVLPLHTPIFDDDGNCTGCSCEKWKRENIDGLSDYVCATPGKHPRHNEWESVATIDTDKISRWWGAWPDANIGIAAGKSGLVVLDADKYKDNGGEYTVGETVTSLTGGGGEHWLFSHPDIEEKLGNSKQGLPQWIDVRGWGGQFVAPPSRHPSGDYYEWESDYGPHEADLAMLPDDITQPLVEASRNLVSVAKFGENVDAPDLEEYATKMPGLLLAILSDDRSKTDFWIVRGLIRAGMDEDEIRAIYQSNDPTGKYTEKNGQGDKYLAHTIAKAKAHIDKRKTNAPVYTVVEDIV